MLYYILLNLSARIPSQKRKGSDRLLSDSEIIFMEAVMHESDVCIIATRINRNPR